MGQVESHASVMAFCHHPFESLKVEANGRVRMCCYQNAWLGNVLNQDLAEIWNGDLAEQIRRATREGQLHQACSESGACHFRVVPRILREIPISKGPTSLQINLPNTHCNVGGDTPTPETACVMCPRSRNDFSTWHDVDRSQEIAEKLRPLMPTLKSLSISGLAEPFWKDRIFDVLVALDYPSHRNHCHLEIFTNGTLLNSERRDRFLEMAPHSHLIFSVDAVTSKTYQAIRRLDVFERVLENIRQFIRARLPSQRVSIANNINMLNVEEAPQMVRLGHELGVDTIIFNPTHEAGKRRDDLRPYLVGPLNYKIFAEAQRAIEEQSRKLNQPSQFMRPLALDFEKNRGAEPAMI